MGDTCTGWGLGAWDTVDFTLVLLDGSGVAEIGASIGEASVVERPPGAERGISVEGVCGTS